MNTVTPMYGWDTLPWKRIQRNVFKLQKCIYQASRNGSRGTDDKRRVVEEPDEGKPCAVVRTE
jgi:N-terminal domain of reverse transcriptase